MLLKGDPEEIGDFLRGMEKEREKIEEEISTLVYYMNGGLDYFGAYSLTFSQMKSLSETIGKHYERQNEAIAGRGNKSR
jgi:hypothetical protein